MNNLTEYLKEALKPLYKELLNIVQPTDSDSAFCVQWGKNYPAEKNEGILFIGKAVNGWNKANDIDTLFGDGNERTFNEADQMQWVEDLEGNQDGYNTRRSAFWRLIKNISQTLYPNNWSSHIAWSNLCKISPLEGGNPNDSLYYKQLASCQKILEKEIEILSPKYVVMLTSGWEKDFLYFLNGNKTTKSVHKEIWGNGYETNVYRIKDTVFITSPHPQGKDGQAHMEAITLLLNKNL